MIVQTIIFAVLLLIMWTIVILLVWHDANQPKIVRCKDCKHSYKQLYTEPSYECRLKCGIRKYLYGTDFCGYGERKETNK